MAQRKKTGQTLDATRTVTAVAFGWLLPGVGHMYAGYRARGIILLTVITVTFWGGVAIGGVKGTVSPDQRRAWFLAQACTGLNAGVALAWARHLPSVPPWEYSEYAPFAPAEDIAVVYTGVAGLLNLLVILDLIGRMTKTPVAAAAGRSPPRGSG